VSMWGPVTDVETVRREQPPLIGNRRQGPDLSQVGARRSPLWLRIHFMNPRDVSDNSIMPRYDYLFRDSRGDDLIAYLASLDNSGHWNSDTAKWQPSSIAHSEATGMNGGELFGTHCATCHTSGGTARSRWSASFHHLPSDLARDAFQHISADASPEQLRRDIARIARFGLQGTDMPGHEYLPDEQIAAIADYGADQRNAARK
jgi:mono/diheme cytochrome c family protein